MLLDEKYINGSSFRYIWKLIIDAFVKKEPGKGLSSNDFTSDEKEKLSDIEPGANKTIVENVFSSISTKNALSANKGRELNDKIEELSELVNADEVYILNENETESDIPEDAVVAIFPSDEILELDWTDFYTKSEIDEIIIKADFKKGKSAYEVATENGFEGSEEEWLTSLKGEPFEYEDFTDEQLDLLKGKEGYSPIRGIDYWTKDDIMVIESYINVVANGIVDNSPLNTLNIISQAINNDPDFYNTLNTRLLDFVTIDGDKVLSDNNYTDEDKDKVNNLKAVSISGNFDDLINVPNSFPANGGNSDTVDNLHFIVSESAPTINNTSLVTIVI